MCIVAEESSPMQNNKRKGVYDWMVQYWHWDHWHERVLWRVKWSHSVHVLTNRASAILLVCFNIRAIKTQHTLLRSALFDHLAKLIGFGELLIHLYVYVYRQLLIDTAKGSMLYVHFYLHLTILHFGQLVTYWRSAFFVFVLLDRLRADWIVALRCTAWLSHHMNDVVLLGSDTEKL